MYSYLCGKITDISYNNIILEISGIGYSITVVSSENFKINQEIKIYIFDYIKDNAEIIMFGFNTYEQLLLFKKLLLVNGVGPKTALTILKYNEVNYIVSLIKSGDFKTLNKVRGVQNRGENIVLELKNKLQEFDVNILRYQNVANILINLHYSEREISMALNRLDDNLTDGEALKLALRIINDERNK